MTSCENQQYPGWRWHHLISNAGRRNTEMDCRRSPSRQQTNAAKFIKRKTCCIYTLSSLKSQSDPSHDTSAIHFNQFCVLKHSKYRTLLHPQKQLILARFRRGLFVSYWRLEKGKKKARGGQWEGKREEARFFPLPIVPRALSIFRLLLFLLGYQAVASAEKRGSFSLAKALNFVFKAQFRRRTFIKADPNKNNNNFILCRHKELKGLPRK